MCQPSSLSPAGDVTIRDSTSPTFHPPLRPIHPSGMCPTLRTPPRRGSRRPATTALFRGDSTAFAATCGRGRTPRGGGPRAYQRGQPVFTTFTPAPFPPAGRRGLAGCPSCTKNTAPGPPAHTVHRRLLLPVSVSRFSLFCEKACPAEAQATAACSTCSTPFVKPARQAGPAKKTALLTLTRRPAPIPAGRSVSPRALRERNHGLAAPGQPKQAIRPPPARGSPPAASRFRRT